MIKKILVPTDGSQFAGIGVRYATSLAKEHGATLRGIHVVDIRLLEGPFLRDISASLGTAPYVNYQSNIVTILEERGEAALKAFTEACEESGVSHETHQCTGSVSHLIVDESELTDLVVMGRGGEHGEWLDGLLGSTTEAVVRHAHCPVLVTERESADLKHFVVAYDGSGHAKKALHFGADIAVTWKVPFTLLVVDKEGGEERIAEARSYLEAHAVDVAYESRSGDPREQITSFALESKADLVVMGAYGHSRVRELLVGSTTAYAINHSPCPVLLTR